MGTHESPLPPFQPLRVQMHTYTDGAICESPDFHVHAVNCFRLPQNCSTHGKRTNTWRVHPGIPFAAAPSSEAHPSLPDVSNAHSISARAALARIEDLEGNSDGLHYRVSLLEAAMDRVSRRIEGTERLVRGPSSPPERLFRRMILFANIAAVKALSATHSELNRKLPYLCPANSVRQLTLTSKVLDCTLYDFRLLASIFFRNPDTTCGLLPSEYRVMHSAPNLVPTSEILFDTYADLCEALQISADVREKGLYRERKNSMGNLRCVQVAGVQLVGQDERKIVVAKSYDERKLWTQGRVQFLTQNCLKWSEGTWETGLKLERGSLSETGSLRSSCPSGPGFSLKWEPLNEFYVPRDASPESVAGALRIQFPMVVVRTRILTSTIQQIFSNEEGSSILKQSLCTTPQNTRITYPIKFFRKGNKKTFTQAALTPSSRLTPSRTITQHSHLFPVRTHLR